MLKKGDFSIMSDNQLKAVHDDDLKSLLTSLGCFEKVSTQQCKCIFCDTVIDVETIGAIVPKEGQIQFVCNNMECLNKLTDIVE